MPDYTTGYALLALYIFIKLWNRAGGWPEAWYRLRGTQYHQFYIISKNGKVERPIVKDSDIETQSLPKWTRKGMGDYHLGDNDHRFANPHGAPAYLYNYDDSRPLAVMRNSPDQAGKLARCDPMLVRAGYHNKNLEKLQGLTEPTHKARDAFLFLLILLGVLAAGLAAYYSYNAACATHSLACVAR